MAMVVVMIMVAELVVTQQMELMAVELMAVEVMARGGPTIIASSSLLTIVAIRPP